MDRYSQFTAKLARGELPNQLKNNDIAKSAPRGTVQSGNRRPIKNVESANVIPAQERTKNIGEANNQVAVVDDSQKNVEVFKDEDSEAVKVLLDASDGKFNDDFSPAQDELMRALQYSSNHAPAFNETSAAAADVDEAKKSKMASKMSQRQPNELLNAVRIIDPEWTRICIAMLKHKNGL